jgi:hypothetical protein
MSTVSMGALLGAIIGIVYSLGRTSDMYRAAVASIREVKIDESNPRARQARGYAVGRQRGIRLVGCIFMGALGIVLGGICGLMVWLVHG